MGILSRIGVCAAGLCVSASAAMADYKMSEFFRDCTIATRIASGQTNSTQSNFAGAVHCLGFIEGAALSMRKTHELYGFAFPNLKKSDLTANKALAQRYIAASILSGFDVCVPDGTTIQTLTLLVVNYLNANPKELSSSPITASNIAWAEAYPCE